MDMADALWIAVRWHGWLRRQNRVLLAAMSSDQLWVSLELNPRPTDVSTRVFGLSPKSNSSQVWHDRSQFPLDQILSQVGSKSVPPQAVSLFGKIVCDSSLFAA